VDVIVHFGILPSFLVAIYLQCEKERNALCLLLHLRIAERWTKDYMKDAYYNKSDLSVAASCSVSNLLLYRFKFITVIVFTDFKY